MHSFEVHSNESACRKSDRLGLEQVISGWSVYLEGALISVKSSMQKTVALLVTDAELMAAVSCAQDMLYAKRIMESLELKVKFPMILEVDNKGTVDLINNWSTGGITRHMDTRQLFLRKMKEQGVFQVKWEKGDAN